MLAEERETRLTQRRGRDIEWRATRSSQARQARLQQMRTCNQAQIAASLPLAKNAQHSPTSILCTHARGGPGFLLLLDAHALARALIIVREGSGHQTRRWLERR